MDKHPLGLGLHTRTGEPGWVCQGEASPLSPPNDGGGDEKELYERMHHAFLATTKPWHQRGNRTWYLEPEYVSVLFKALLDASGHAVLTHRVQTLEEDAARYRALRDSLYIVNLGANTNYYVSSDAFMDRMPDGVDGYADWLRSRALAEPTP